MAERRAVERLPRCGHCGRQIEGDVHADACNVCGHDCHGDCLVHDEATGMLYCISCHAEALEAGHLEPQGVK